MRPFLLKLVSAILLITVSTVSVLADKSTEEARLIRKAFLDIKHVPPTPAELTWYLCYNSKPYEAAVKWLIPSDSLLQKYFLSEQYKRSSPNKLDLSVLDFIIKYQAGDTNSNIDKASKLLVQIAIVCGEDNTTDIIDYLSLCLIARSTNIDEINHLLKVFRNFAREEDGYIAVLNELKQHKEFIFN